MRAKENQIHLIGWKEERGEGAVLVTPWSVIHFFSGVALENMGFGFWSSQFIHGLYEIKDIVGTQLGYEYNSALNSLADQGFATAGHLSGNFFQGYHSYLLWPGVAAYLYYIWHTSEEYG